MARYEIDNAAAPIDFTASEPVRRTLQNAKNLLMCRMGEVPYVRHMGFDPALLEKPVDEVNRTLLPEIDRIMLWEPDAEVVSARAVRMESGETYIRVTLDIAEGEEG